MVKDVLHVADFLPRYHQKWGGAEQACWRLFKLLAKQGLSLNIASTVPIRTPGENYNYFYLKTLKDLLPLGLKPVYTRITSIIPIDFIVFIQFYRLASRLKPKLIHLHNFKQLSFSIIWAARMCRIPLVLSIYDYWYFCPKETLMHARGELCLKFHGPECANCLNLAFYLKPQLRLRRAVFNLFLKRIDVFVVLSASSGQILRRYGIDRAKINLVPQPAPLEDEIVPTESCAIRHPSLVLIAALSPNKGVDTALHCLAFVKKQLPELNLYIVGAEKERASKRYLQKIKQILEQEHLNQAVVFLEKLAPAKTRAFLAAADAVIIPEQWPNMSPVVLTEAMLMAKPVVVSRIGGLSEFIKDGENGFLASPGAAGEFAEKIVWMLKHPAQAAKLGERARADAQRIWNNQLNLQKIVKLYESLS